MARKSKTQLFKDLNVTVGAALFGDWFKDILDKRRGYLWHLHIYNETVSKDSRITIQCQNPAMAHRLKCMLNARGHLVMYDLGTATRVVVGVSFFQGAGFQK